MPYDPDPLILTLAALAALALLPLGVGALGRWMSRRTLGALGMEVPVEPWDRAAEVFVLVVGVLALAVAL